ncbi:hypothetical protein KSC_037620 [Ktedonobacter sp. SOSP1-52]|nr:hypothetical protein KSC_037620 [Ktedonobacter sp. SOSP1-52]
MSNVFVVDPLKQPLTPVHPGRARRLLTTGKAAVYRTAPFTIILKREVEHPAPAPLRLKIDPGARTTGLALVDDAGGEVVWAAELTHRGAAIKKSPGHPPDGTPRAPIPQDPLSHPALCQPQAQSRLAATLAPLAGGKHSRLGHANQQDRARERALPGTGALRSAEDGAPGHLRHRVSAGHPVRL